MSVDIRIVSKRLEYEIRIEEKITFICGDSATGKTQMTRLIDNADNPSVKISVSNGFEMINVTRAMFNSWIQHANKQVSKNKFKDIEEYFSDIDNFPVTEKIIVVDDDAFVMSADFSAFVNADKYNYYIIINRTQTARIGYPVTEVYSFMANGRYHWIERRNFMKKSMTIAYEVGRNLYLNLTNQCPCACTFCIRNHADGAYGSDPLWLEHEPSMEEIINALSSLDLISYDEIVFCGYGEPTCRLDIVIETAQWLRDNLKDAAKLRINTNGLGDLINGRSIAEELCAAMDVVSVSLNAGTVDEYMKVTRPKFDNAFEAMQQFTADCVKTKNAEIIMSVVDVIPEEQIAASRDIAEKLGAKLRVRTFDE